MTYQIIGTNPIVNIKVSSNISKITSENKFQRDLTIRTLKRKLELISGATSNYMELIVYNEENAFVCSLDNDDKLLGSYPIDNGMRLHVKDTSGISFNFDDCSKVNKYELPDDSYAERKDSLRVFKEQLKLGQFAEISEEEKIKKAEEEKEKDRLEMDKINSIRISSRCEVALTGQPRKRGVVMYVGLTDFKPGYWVGVKYDEPLGKNNGSVNGKTYFECLPKYGAFIKPFDVNIGDFPEINIDEEMDEM